MLAASAPRRSDGFVAPDFRSPLDPADYIAAVRPGATMRGLHFNTVLHELRRFGHGPGEFGPYMSFKDYPQTEILRLHAYAARTLYPDEPLREGLRRIGWTLFPAMLDSLVGRVVFGALGSDLKEVFRYAHKGIEVSMTHSVAEVLSVTDGRGVLRVSDNAIYADCLIVGILEGGLAHYGAEADVHVSITSRTSVIYECTW